MSAKKFHVNPEGRVMECGAKIKCNFADSPHFTNEQEAYDHAEKMAAEEHEKKSNDVAPQETKDGKAVIEIDLDMDSLAEKTKVYEESARLSLVENDFYMRKWAEEAKNKEEDYNNLASNLFGEGYNITGFDGDYPTKIVPIFGEGVEIVGRRKLDEGGKPYGRVNYETVANGNASKDDIEVANRALAELEKYRERREMSRLLQCAQEMEQKCADIVSEGEFPSGQKTHEDDEPYYEAQEKAYAEFQEHTKKVSPKEAIDILKAEIEKSKEAMRSYGKYDHYQSLEVSGRHDALHHLQDLHNNITQGFPTDPRYTSSAQKAQQERHILNKHLRSAVESYYGKEKELSQEKLDYAKGRTAAAQQSIVNYRADYDMVRQTQKEEDIASTETLRKTALQEEPFSMMKNGGMSKDYVEGFMATKRSIMRDLRENDSKRTHHEILLSGAEEGHTIKTHNGEEWTLTTDPDGNRKEWRQNGANRIESTFGMLNRLSEDNYRYQNV